VVNVDRHGLWDQWLRRAVTSFCVAPSHAALEYLGDPARYHAAYDFNRLRSNRNRVMLIDAAGGYAGQQLRGSILLQGRKHFQVRPIRFARRIETPVCTRYGRAPA
jgi:hypothetical protein